MSLRRCNFRNASLIFLAIFASAGPVWSEPYPGRLPDHRVAKGAATIAEAWLTDATQRYAHFVLGSRYEAGGLAVRLRVGRVLTLKLDRESVFEDRKPRIADFDGDGRDDILVVRSYLDRGAALAIVSVIDDKLAIIAETPPTGRANTWRNPAGVADFTGDGRVSIAEVQMPHILGRLRLWRLERGLLREIATMDDASNHVAGSPKLDLSATVDVDGDGIPELAIPSKDRRWLRILSFKGGAGREIRRHPLTSPATSEFMLEPGPHGQRVVIGREDGTIVRLQP